ncbi:MAG TPA: energy transducer TonB [Candidatus Binatia bacterium]|nr:energy transducer TonB [Candidatus Binatia bacterium]
MTSNWDDGNVFAVFRSPFLLPSIVLHIFLMALAMHASSLSLAKPAPEAPITVQLEDFKGVGSDTKSIGPAKGPGGPRELPKLGTPNPPAPRTGKIDSGSVEPPLPSPAVETPPPPPQPAALPGPKVLASNTRSEHVNANETAPDSLVRLPTKAAPTHLPGSASNDTGVTQHNDALTKPGEGPGIKALNEGAQIPGALKGSGSGTGPLGVPGGSRAGSGLAGGGTGCGSGGGGSDGVKGASNLDFNRYLEQLERRVKSVWKYPEEVAGVQEVAVRFSLDRAGKLIQAQVLDSSDTRLNTSAIDAMKRASPFPPIPESLAKELANEPLIVRFKVSIRVRG